MLYKKCKWCGRELPISEFYAHPQMSDGHLNKCKECVKSSMRERYAVNTLDEEYVQKERERGREKYARLGYRGKRTGANRAKRDRYKGIRKARKLFHFNSNAYVELHHWNYNILNQVIVLDRRLHKRIHGVMEFNLEIGYYFKDGEPLDTIEKHLSIIRAVCERDGFDFSEVKVLSR